MESRRRILAVPTLAAVLVALQGCGGGRKPQPPTGPPLDDHTPSDPQPECPEIMRQKLQDLVHQYATQYGAAMGAGFVGPVPSWATNDSEVADTVCSLGFTSPGPEGGCRGDCERRAFPQGSFTKLWTASAVMKLYEEDAINLDEPAFKYLEGAYRRGGGKGSLTERFGTQIRHATVRQILGMRASLADFDEWQYQKEHPLVDMSPALLADKYGAGTSQSNGTAQPLDTCGAYSSMGYTLLGLLLINVSGSDQWSDYNQNVWKKQFPDVDFGVLGPCRNYTDVSGKSWGRDFLDFSCTAGYSCGNLVARPITVAAFVKDLFEGKLLKDKSLQEMMQYQKLGDGCDSGRAWGQGAPYGLGVMGNPVSFKADHLATRIPGHRGSTYGYVSLAAYDTEAKASISVAAGGMFNDAKLSLWKDIHTAFLDRWPLREGDDDGWATLSVVA